MGLTDIVLDVENQDPVSGQFSVDNYGEASIGSERALGSLDFNSVFGFGEEFGVLGVVTPELQLWPRQPRSALERRWPLVGSEYGGAQLRGLCARIRVFSAAGQLRQFRLGS